MYYKIPCTKWITRPKNDEFNHIKINHFWTKLKTSRTKLTTNQEQKYPIYRRENPHAIHHE